MLYIDPEHCIDCAACQAECPAEAIYYEDDVPQEERPFIALNAELAKTTPGIFQRKAPLVGM